MASHFDLSVIAIVGIMRVDVAFTLSATRVWPEQAIYQASVKRFRPNRPYRHIHRRLQAKKAARARAAQDSLAGGGLRPRIADRRNQQKARARPDKRQHGIVLTLSARRRGVSVIDGLMSIRTESLTSDHATSPGSATSICDGGYYVA
jgi:hypothetical protein